MKVTWHRGAGHIIGSGMRGVSSRREQCFIPACRSEEIALIEIVELCRPEAATARAFRFTFGSAPIAFLVPIQIPPEMTRAPVGSYGRCDGHTRSASDRYWFVS
jgi:hypothetical protein